MKRALLWVTDHTGIVEFANALVGLGWDIISTGDTATVLAEGGVMCVSVEDITNFPEMLDGCVKMLHPKVFGGILADRTNPAHLEALETHGIPYIDLVAVNLSDFARKPDIEQIDIDRVALLRAAAQNAAWVIVVADPNAYGPIIRELKLSRELSRMMRERLFINVFEATAAYDGMICRWAKRQFSREEDFLHPAAGASL